MKVNADDLLKKYRELQQISSGESHEKAYNHLKSLVIDHQDDLYDLVFSGKVTDIRDFYGLILFGADGGSVAKEYNEHWIPFLSRVYARIDELPLALKGSLEHYAAQWGIVDEAAD